MDESGALRGGSLVSKKNKPEVAEQQASIDGPERLYEFADSVNAEIEAAEAAEEAKKEREKWLLFRLDQELFTVPVARIQEILRIQRITPVPHAPYTVRGITNLRGHVIPVVDLRVRLGLKAAEITPSSRILITVSKERALGLLVDEVEQILNLDPDAVEPPPADVMTGHSEYIAGIYRNADQLAVLLEVDRVLVIPESLEQVNAEAISNREELEPVGS